MHVNSIEVVTKDTLDLGREYELKGYTYCLQLDHIDSPFYVTINHRDIDGDLIPYEMFINSFDPKQIDWITPVSRLISAIFREQGDLGFLIKELKDTFSYEYFYYRGVKYHSVAALVGEVLDGHLFMLEELNTKLKNKQT